MWTRCTNPNQQNYDRYGGRGITVDERWAQFPDFLRDMGVRPDGLTIERIDGAKGYSPENCRWATRAEQNQNKKDTHRIEYNGETKNASQWAKIVGIRTGAFLHRLNSGWSIEQAINTPKMPASLRPLRSNLTRERKRKCAMK